MNTDKSFCGKHAPIVVGFGRCSGGIYPQRREDRKGKKDNEEVNTDEHGWEKNTDGHRLKKQVGRQFFSAKRICYE